MKLGTKAVLVLLSLSICHGLHAQAAPDSALSLQGFSGVLNTPNGHTQREGTFNVLYTNQRDNIAGYGIPTWEDNYIFSVGMFRFAEVGGRLVQTSTYPNNTSVRDLSANWKLSTAPLTARYRFSPALAVGMQDVGGAAHFFGTKYVVGSVDPLGWVRFSVGYGNGPSRMKGAFGGMELRLHPWVTVLGDYDTSHANGGVRLTAPTLPFIPVRLTATFSSPLKDSPGLGIAGGLIIPLDFKKASRRDAAAAEEARAAQHTTLWGTIAARRAQVPPAATASAPPVVLPTATPVTPVLTASAPSEPALPGHTAEAISPAVVRDRLIREGFVNVRVGMQDKTLVVEYENIRYNHTELDAIGVVTGIASQAAGEDVDQLRLVVRRRGLALLQIETPILPLRDWLEGEPGTHAPAFAVTQELAGDYGVDFLAGKTNHGYLKPSIMIYPALTTLVGTEYGIFDYQLSIRPELQVPLWRGATGVARADLPVAHSGNLNDGMVYAGYRTDAQMDRLMFFQAVTLAPGLVANLGVGKIQTTTNGTLNELNWIPGGGTNRLKVIQAWGRDGDKTRNVFLGSYRLFLPRYDLGFETTAGRFYGQDQGFMLSLQRFFGDASTSLYFKDTVLQNDTHRWLQAGIQIEFPLTPRRDMKARPIQIRGNQDWSYAQETGVASSATQNSNYIQPNLAIVPLTTEALPTYFYDRERLNADYILTHTERIKDGWLFFRGRL